LARPCQQSSYLDDTRIGGLAITTVSPERSRLKSLRVPRLSRSGWVSAAKEALDRPLTTYYLLLGSVGLLLTIGLIMVMSASSVASYRGTGSSYTVVERQAMWLLLALPCAYFAARVSPTWLRRLVYPGFVLSLGLLLLTAFMGRTVQGNTNWLVLGPIQLQPSEIAKFAIIIWAAHIYAMKERRLDRLNEILVPVVPGMGLALGLVLLGDDLGTALVFFAILVGMLWVVGAPRRLFVLATLLVGVLAGGLAVTSPVRLARLSNFTDPFRAYHSTGWQAVHGLFALASGGVFGEGIGASQQKWGSLPEAYTDYIFAVLGEELGLIGTLLVIGLFLTIAYAIVRIARETTDPFVRYASFGVVIWLLGQMMINVGMVLGLAPVIGIPLPLVSYGGSSLVPTLTALGLVIGFARREPAAARALAQKRRDKAKGVAAR